MNEQLQRGMGRPTPARGASVCCPSCSTEAFRLAPGASVVGRGAGVEQVRPCAKCGGIVRVFVQAAP